MGVLIIIVCVVVAVLVIGKLGDWLDEKTGWVLGAIIAGVIGTYLISGTVRAHEESITPRPEPLCKITRTC
jgi:hypothetical protein